MKRMPVRITPLLITGTYDDLSEMSSSERRTPLLSMGKKTPVMLCSMQADSQWKWFEQDGYHGENFAKKGSIFVSNNQRLGPLVSQIYQVKRAKSCCPLAMSSQLDIIAPWSGKRQISNLAGDPKQRHDHGQSGGGAKVTCTMQAALSKVCPQRRVAQRINALFAQRTIATVRSLGQICNWRKAELTPATVA